MAARVPQRDGTALAALIGANSEDPVNVRIATILQAQLAAIGMRTTIKVEPTRIWFTPQGLLRNGKATLVAQSWVGGGDPEQSLNLRCVQAVPGDANHAFYCSQRFEALYDDQARTASQARRDRDFDMLWIPVAPEAWDAR